MSAARRAPRCAGRVMLGPETYIVRSADDAMALRARAGDYVWIDPDVPLADGGLVAVRDPDRGAETVVRRFVEHNGRRTLHTLDARRPARIIDAGNETDIRGVVVCVGNTV